MRPLRILLVAACACAGACSTNDTGTLSLLLGGETDTLSRAPAPTQLVVDTLDTSGRVTPLSTVSLAGSATTISLADASTSTVASIRVRGEDATGALLVWGLSLPVDFSAFPGGNTLGIFIQRTGELARMPSSLSNARPAPVVASVGARFVLLAGGTDPATALTSEIYDLAMWSPLDAPPTLPRMPKSLAAIGTTVLLLDEQAATWFNLDDSTTADAPAPPGGTYAEIAGGRTVVAPDGTSYLVGATRAAGDATARVLVVSPAGVLSFATLASPRLGAAATWMTGRGLVVAGGSADPTAAGLELVGPGATNGVALPFASDATTGAGAAAIDTSHVLLVGGISKAGADAGARLVDVTCTAANATTSCAPAAWTAPLTTPLTLAQAFDLDGLSALVIGDDAAGATHAYRVTQAAAAEVPLKVPRSGGRPVVLSTGAIAIAGGATVMESFAPF